MSRNNATKPGQILARQTQKARRGWRRAFSNRVLLCAAQQVYRSSDNTDCGSWLACATMALPACCKMLARLMLADSLA
jgi:hypothetical protein